MSDTKPRKGNLRVWWVPQIPMKPFMTSVRTQKEAVRLLNILAEYDLFQYENLIKPDYCNAGGIEIFEDGEWCELDLESDDG